MDRRTCFNEVDRRIHLNEVDRKIWLNVANRRTGLSKVNRRIWLKGRRGEGKDGGCLEHVHGAAGTGVEVSLARRLLLHKDRGEDGILGLCLSCHWRQHKHTTGGEGE